MKIGTIEVRKQISYNLAKFISLQTDLKKRKEDF